MYSRFLKSFACTWLFLALTSGITGASAPLPAEDKKLDDPGYTAFLAAKDQGKFLMVYAYQDQKESLVLDSFTALRNTYPDRIDSLLINILAPGEAWLVNAYNLRYAPLPMILVIAPNGAITGSFPKPIAEGQLQTALCSPVTQECLLAFQQRKLVALCIQGSGTRDNQAALDGVTQLAGDPVYGKMTQVIKLDPADPEETLLLKQLGLTEPPSTALTLILAPPGKLIGRWEGPTTRESLVNRLAAATASSRSCVDPSCQDPTCPPPPAKRQ